MPSGNLEQLRQGHEAFTRGDLSPLSAIVADDVDWGTTGSFPGLEPSYRGLAAMETWMDAVRSAWERFEVSIDEVIRDDPEVMVVGERLRGVGRESGVEVDMRIFAVYWFDGGRVTRRRVFEDREAATEAAEA
jgi:ketosteroid isomerase-like protein